MKNIFLAISFVLSAVLVLTIPLPSSGHSLAKATTLGTEIWSDEFNDPVAGRGINTSNWIYDLGQGYKCSGCPANWGTGEVESMSKSTTNVFEDGKSHLVIKATRDAKGTWTSGRIETQHAFAAPPGGELAILASLEQPSVSSAAGATGAAGYWPAFWIIGTQFRGNYLNWPSVGEIDIMEDVNGLSSEFGTLHCGVAQGGPCNETTGIGSGKRPCPGCQNAFHTYMLIIDRSTSPEQIRWYLDNVNFFTLKASQFPASTWSAAVDHSFFIILNLAIGGAFPATLGGGPNSSTTSGGSLKVDYVHVYVANGSSTPIRTPSPTSISTRTNKPSNA